MLHQDLARAHLAWRQQEAQDARRRHAAADHERWRRKALRAAHREQRAAQRAHLLLAAR